MRALENVISDFEEKFPGFRGHVARTHESPNMYTVSFQKEETFLTIEVIETEDPDMPNVLVMMRRNIGVVELHRMMRYFMRRLHTPPKSSQSSEQPPSRDLSSEFEQAQ